jgi:hypothetical protein
VFSALLARSGSSAEELVAASHRIGAGRSMRIALRLCRALLGVPMSDPVADDAHAGRLAEGAAARMLGEQPRWNARDTADNLRFNLALCDSPGDRARTAWRWATLPSPEDWSRRPLPDALFPLYRLLRPLRLLSRYGGRAGSE